MDEEALKQDLYLSFLGFFLHVFESLVYDEPDSSNTSLKSDGRRLLKEMG